MMVKHLPVLIDASSGTQTSSWVYSTPIRSLFFYNCGKYCKDQPERTEGSRSMICSHRTYRDRLPILPPDVGSLKNDGRRPTESIWEKIGQWRHHKLTRNDIIENKLSCLSISKDERARERARTTGEMVNVRASSNEQIIT